MLKVAITGNIGTGKTTVCRVFESLGVKVYYADKEARKFYSNAEVIHSVRQLFGNDIFDAGGALRSAELAGIVFNDTAKLKQLNAIIHPLVLEDFIQWAKQQEGTPYIIYESALLFESGFDKYFDKSILVTAPDEIAKARVIARDQVTEADYVSRKASQMTENEKETFADIILNNAGEKPLIPQVIALHTLLMKSIQ